MNRTFKTTRFTLIATGLLLCSLSACSSSGDETATSESASTTQAGPTRAGNDAASATPHEDSGAPGRVIARTSFDASLKVNYPKINDLFSAPEVDAAVVGVIRDVEYRTVDGTLAKTVLTVTVNDSQKENVPAEITVWEDGGYVRAADIAKENADKFPDSEVKTPDGWVEFTFEGATHPEVGQTVLLFLNKNPNLDQGDSYQEVSSVFGRFILQDGNYTRTAREGWENTVTRSTVETRFAAGKGSP